MNYKPIEWQLGHTDISPHVKRYHEFDDDNTHIEGGIPILHQSLEQILEGPYPPHEEVLAT